MDRTETIILSLKGSIS